MQMPLWVSREEEIKEGSWNWLQQAVLESREETARTSCGPWQELPFRARECQGTVIFRIVAENPQWGRFWQLLCLPFHFSGW